MNKEAKMSTEKYNRPIGRESYQIGDVGAHARVQQGKYLTMIEQTFTDTPGGDDLTKQFKALLDKIAEHPDIDGDTCDLAMEKTQKVAEALANAKESPSDLRRALLDAKAWLSSAVSWAWDEASKILKSEAAQKVISTISEASVRGAIKSLIGGV
jgi:hypothetical protein